MKRRNHIRPIGLIGPIRPIGLIGLIGLISLMGACSSSDEVPEPEIPIEVVSYVASFDESVAVTRAWTPPTGYSLYGAGANAIGVWFTQDGSPAKVLDGFFFQSSGKWRTSVELTTAGDYYLYGYVPHTPGITGSIVPGASSLYANGATLTLENVPAVTPNDLCVVIGAKQGTDKETVTGLKRGDFAFTAEAISDETPKNFVFLLFDHLYSAVRINMKVHDTYNKLRTIKLKKLELMTKAGDTKSKQKTTIVIGLAANGSGTDPITSVTYTPTGADIEDGMEFWSSAAGEELTTAYSEHIAHFMPKGITKLKLTSTYDVYDKQGNLIRKDCKATNNLVLEDLFTGQVETQRGSRYTIEMTIEPTYLYMLSDPDLDSPTVVIN